MNDIMWECAECHKVFDRAGATAHRLSPYLTPECKLSVIRDDKSPTGEMRLGT